MVKRLFLLVLILAAAGILYWLIKGDSDEVRIRKSFETFARAASKEAGEGTTALLIKTQTLGKLFDEKCSLEGTKTFLDGNYTPEEVTSNAVMARKHASSLSMRFHDLTVNISSPEDASARFTVRVTGISANAGGSFSESREMNATLRKKEGKWLFTSFKVIDVFEK